MTACRHVHYGFNCSGRVVPGPRFHACPSCGATADQPCLLDDELPPVIGERYRDTFNHIQRAAWEAAQEALHHD